MAANHFWPVQHRQRAAVVGGFLVSALGGSRFQIGGPAGALIVLVSTTVSTMGLQGLLLAVLLSGVFLTAAGLFRIGTLVRHIPNCWLYMRHRRHHLCQSNQGSLRPDSERGGTWAASSQTLCPWQVPANVVSGGVFNRKWFSRSDIYLKTLAA